MECGYCNVQHQRQRGFAVVGDFRVKSWQCTRLRTSLALQALKQTKEKFLAKPVSCSGNSSRLHVVIVSGDGFSLSGCHITFRDNIIHPMRCLV